ncbi:MAG: NAD(P)H-binding protein [Parvibaculaceae bacterium]
MTNNRSAIVAGATGLVGGFLLERLLASPDYEAVTCVTRKQIAEGNPKLRQVVGPLDDAESMATNAGVKATDAYCTLGTTIKTAGSQPAFRKVDFDYVMNFARAAKAAGATRFMLVSAIGASASSQIFYSRIKGETEEALGQMGFEALHIFRPGLLLGARGERRAAESMMMTIAPLLNPLMLGPATVYKSINADAVAAAMIATANTGTKGRQIYTYKEMMQLARKA